MIIKVYIFYLSLKLYIYKLFLQLFNCIRQGGVCKDEADLMGEWFSLVHEKNALVRWEQELLVKARELELEDRHVRLEEELRRRMALPG